MTAASFDRITDALNEVIGRVQGDGIRSGGDDRVGDRVRIERDETLYPSKGTWPQFRGRTGTIVEINGDEYGVIFGRVWPRDDRPGVLRWGGNDVITWFQAHEVTKISGAGSRRHAGRVHSTPEGCGNCRDN